MPFRLINIIRGGVCHPFFESQQPYKCCKPNISLHGAKAWLRLLQGLTNKQLIVPRVARCPHEDIEQLLGLLS